MPLTTMALDRHTDRHDKIYNSQSGRVGTAFMLTRIRMVGKFAHPTPASDPNLSHLRLPIQALLQLLRITLRGFADELGLALEVTAAGTHHHMQANRQPFIQSEFFIQAL